MFRAALKCCCQDICKYEAKSLNPGAILGFFSGVAQGKPCGGWLVAKKLIEHLITWFVVIMFLFPNKAFIYSIFFKNYIMAAVLHVENQIISGK